MTVALDSVRRWISSAAAPEPLAAATIGVILDAIPTATLLVDQAGRIVFSNHAALRLFDYERGELDGECIELLVPERYRESHASDRANFWKKPARRPIGGGRGLTARRSDGKELAVEIGLGPVEVDRAPHVIVAISDISLRRQAELALHRAYADLEAHILELEKSRAEMLRTNEALVSSNTELERFAYVASHDLKAPLRSISGFVQLLQESHAGQLDPRAESWIQRTVESVRHMQNLIDDLLSYARIDAEPRPFSPTPLNEVCDDVIAMLEPAIRESSALITRGNLPTIHGDPAQLSQLFNNLIGNALKYTKKQPGVSPRLHVDALESDGCWEIRFRDNGIGIDPAQHEKIFEIFRRGHAPDDTPGTGIGLAICRRIMRRHGGSIRVDSEPGQGSTFILAFAQRQDSTGSADGV